MKRNSQKRQNGQKINLHSITSVLKKNFRIIISVFIVILGVGIFYFYSRKSKLNIPDDLEFLKGFPKTGSEWIEPGQTYIEKKKNDTKLCELRNSYCTRVGYNTGGCQCGKYQYYNSYNIYKDKSESFTVYYPTLWEREGKPSGYRYVTSPEVSLKRKGASCVLSYGLVDKKKLLSFDKASTSEVDSSPWIPGNNSSKYKKLSKVIFPFDRELTEEEKAAGYTNIKLIAVPHFPYSFSSLGFVLRSGDKQPLLEACVEEFQEIMDSRSITYTPVKLSDESTGRLSLQFRSSLFESNPKIPNKTTLLLEDSATGQENSILSGLFPDDSEVHNPFLTGGKLFYMYGPIENPVIKSANIFSGEMETIPLEYDTENPIHSFFIKEDMLYYLSGKFCNEYMGICQNMSLKKYNLTSGTVETLTNKSSSRDIKGFDASGESLILELFDGDGPCYWGTLESYSFSDKSLKDYRSYSKCSFEGEDEEEEDGPDTTTADIVPNVADIVPDVRSFYYLVIKNGRILAPRSKIGYSSVIPIRISTTEYPYDE